ncbi:MAG: HNH endonuclease signature motif containing protein [Gemmatimonadota bacterium]|nr:HNH endonuclease signature motif containing protein [Gemmatimonadota bacterium]
MRCEQCGSLFGVPQWSAPKKVRLHFCCKACLDAWATVDPDAGEGPALKGRPQFRGGNWKVLAAEARERDGFRCRSCGVTEETLGRQLDEHHKIPVRLFASAAAANRPDNLISVCRPCHKRMEDRTAVELPLFRDVRHPGQRQDRA